MRAFLVGVGCLVVLGVLGGVLHFALGIGWFSIISHDIHPAEKADYLSSLLDSPVLKAISLGVGSLFSAVAFGLYSGTSRPYISNLIYALFAAASVVPSVIESSKVAIVSFICILALSFIIAQIVYMLRNRQSKVTEEEAFSQELTFQEQIQAIRQRQRSSKQSSPNN